MSMDMPKLELGDTKGLRMEELIKSEKTAAETSKKEPCGKTDIQKSKITVISPNGERMCLEIERGANIDLVIVPTEDGSNCEVFKYDNNSGKGDYLRHEG